jgi:hypothetical protein
VIEQTFPDFIKSREDLRTSQFIIANQQRQFGDDLTIPIAEGTRAASERPLEGQEVHDIPSGMVWNLDAEPSGELHGGVLFNLDEFDERTVAPAIVAATPDDCTAGHRGERRAGWR